MKSKAICLGVAGVLLVTVIATIPCTNAGECKYGKVEAWARTLNDDGDWGEWRNATVHETLKTHEPFQTKVNITTNLDCQHVYLWLSRVGSTHAYEVKEGESTIMEPLRNHDCNSNWSKEYIWTIKPTGNWTEGTAALNVEGQFHAFGKDKFIDFTVIAAYIEPQEWQGGNGDASDNDTGDNGNATDSGNGGVGLPGFEGLTGMAAILIALAVLQIRRKRWQE